MERYSLQSEPEGHGVDEVQFQIKKDKVDIIIASERCGSYQISTLFTNISIETARYWWVCYIENYSLHRIELNESMIKD